MRAMGIMLWLRAPNMPTNFTLLNLIASEYMSIDTSGRWNIVGAYTASVDFAGLRPQFLPPLYIFIAVTPKTVSFPLYFRIISPGGQDVFALQYEMNGNYDPGQDDVGVWAFQLPPNLEYKESGTYLLNVFDSPEDEGEFRRLPILFTEPDTTAQNL